jgi:hypothetical protein
MMHPNIPLRDVMLFTQQPNAVEALERLRNSYEGPPVQDALTGADQAVLAAVQITLKHLAKAS